MRTLIRRLRRDEQAATAAEYAIMLAGIFLVVIAAVLIFGQKLVDFFGDVPNKF